MAKKKGFWFEESESLHDLREEIRRLMQLVIDLQIAGPPQDGVPNAPFLLQVAVLGALVGNPALRETGQAKAFIDFDLGAAASELETAKGRTGWPALQKFLLMLGVEWNEKEAPAKRMIRRLGLDADTSRALAYLNAAAANAIHGSDESKARFLEMVATAGESLRIRKPAPPSNATPPTGKQATRTAPTRQARSQGPQTPHNGRRP